MVNEIVRKEHVFVIQRDYYYRKVNVHKQKHREEHRETKKIRNEKENNLI